MKENTMTNKNDTAADLPLAPNGHGPSNGSNGDPREARSASPAPSATDAAGKDVPSSSKKKKKKRHAHNNKPAIAQTARNAAVMTDPSAPLAPVETITEQTPSDASAEAPIEEQLPSEAAAAPIEAPVESLRLRMKVWTDHTTSRRYLMPSAFMRDVVNGQPVTDVMYAYAMRDDDTKLVTLSANEWNALPFFYFEEDGPAPRATTRPVDVIVSYARTP